MNLLLAASAAVLLTACGTPRSGSAPASTSTTGAAAPDAPRIVKSRDGRFDGEVSGTPAAGSKFSRLQIGMSMQDVQTAMGRAPDRWHTYESGKRWIPFYFGNDARRMQAFYSGEGCLIFTDGNVWGGAGGDLIRIDHDAAGRCYQP
ncbi:hypothetical protein ABXN37_07330 [Piscinibacter sakaiensis]|uniref:Uncharacterized protein n=1 Tax=Piscinibacter sakaiensis TaxID=1547922 RepID=A0A0K8NX32_PISS1|nr:hypothetical protein [Piscinibacter sakaiensis]GAP34962.1 hypothetical protein ISF6_0512 [Piscinibacter sakaiensis]